MTRSAILGSTGFVGSTIAGQIEFTEHYHSKNIDALSGTYDRIVCAAAPGRKWVANQHPDEDWFAISSLIEALSRVSAREFILISTVDVFDYPVMVDELTEPNSGSLTPYGAHRLRLEFTVRSLFEQTLIMRLPGLVGSGLRKNIIYDLHNSNNLDSVDSRSVFQFYPMENLWKDISVGLEHGLDLLHLTSEPTSVAEISKESFGRKFQNELGTIPANYDFRSIHASIYGASGDYQYSASDVFRAGRKYHETEPYGVGRES